jgi:hypothetical protein
VHAFAAVFVRLVAVAGAQSHRIPRRIVLADGFPVRVLFLLLLELFRE